MNLMKQFLMVVEGTGKKNENDLHTILELQARETKSIENSSGLKGGGVGNKHKCK